MKRTSEFDKTKLMSVSSKNSVANLYVDAFPIEQVKLRLATYGENSTFIDIYVGFSTFLKLANDIRSGRFLQLLANSPNGLIITRGGSAKSSRPDGKPESRILSAQMSQTGSVFLNATQGAGKLNQTGLIMPDGAPDKKISVMMSQDQLQELFIYGAEAIKAFLPQLVVPMVNLAQTNRSNTN